MKVVRDDTRYWYSSRRRQLIDATYYIPPGDFTPLPRPLTHTFSCCCHVMREILCVKFDIDILLNRQQGEIRRA